MVVYYDVRSPTLLHFIHTPLFDESVDEALGPDGLRTAQMMIQANPHAGRLMEGTGGARKLRVGIGGRGKSYGARVVYYYQSSENIVYLLLAYAKPKRTISRRQAGGYCGQSFSNSECEKLEKWRRR